MAGLTRGRRAATAVIAVIAVFATGALSGCDWRRETPPPVWPTPDAATAARDALAVATDGVIAAAERALDDDPSDAFAAAALASATVHLDALGGVYVAFPDSGASPPASASAETQPVPDLDEAIGAARAAAEAATGAGEHELAALARAIDLEWALREALWPEPESSTDASASGSPSDAPSPGPSVQAGPTVDAGPTIDAGPTVDASSRTPFPPASGGADSDPAFAPGDATTLSQADLAELALAHDHARFAYETIAAWEAGQARAAALALADLHRELSDEFAATLADDPRTPVYQLRDANLPDAESRRALELSVELEIALTLASALESAPDAELPWLLNATFDAFTRASTARGFAEDDLPTLPGVIVAAPVS